MPYVIAAMQAPSRLLSLVVLGGKLRERLAALFGFWQLQVALSVLVWDVLRCDNSRRSKIMGINNHNSIYN